MKKIGKRIAAFLITLCTIFTALPVDGIHLVEAKAAEEVNYVTKIEWLKALTDAFEFEVEEDNYPDNYFTDSKELTKGEYYTLMLATQSQVQIIRFLMHQEERMLENTQ